MEYHPQISDIESAYHLIKPYIHKTPVLTSESVNTILGAELFLKCENFQKVGAFKFRGATNAVLRLTDEEAKRGVATHSSGNHAAALALAAKKRGIPAYIVMPDNAPSIKKKAVAGYGGIITFCMPTQQAREETLAQIQKETGATFIHPYNNFDVICGQGTASLELLEEIPNLDIVIAPVGGGGLLSGTATYVKGKNPAIKVFGAEPQRADDAYRSLRDKTIYPSVSPKTIADGLLTSLCPLTYEIISENCDGIFTVTEESIVAAMRMVWERMKIIIEPSSAVPIAAIMSYPDSFRNKRVGVIISGGNVDLDNLPW
ncbi:MAG TPA: pyridoxal-phosphate dependent enzyme [Tenuifilaceae bacterium]|nr:pyridoxal-phosphate dependent enzyme [Tenuifilaceae bacterium]HOZ13507.1 pyridoxal-phosphate dependent enzyme [Tenuifilaceae bacterium]HPI44849.1 pyridoxal-phosphate dependent enzyme [Tenuifilaceae bacterium]HPN20750.1 pyridoxal-phosphate dependent enzyme [Tenuifilaceae bacterium]